MNSDGWTAWYHSSSVCFDICGSEAPRSIASDAFAPMKSSSPITPQLDAMSSAWGRMMSVKAIRIAVSSRFSSISSSRIRFPASTTSAGSMKTVLPVALSSWTMPLICLFIPAATGITRRPSRTAGDASFSTMPAATAESITLRMARCILPWARRMFWRIS